jgi:hypothetical protein
MSICKSLFLLGVLALCSFVSPLLGQEQSKPPQRDPTLLEVLTRVVQTAGGAQALSAVHGLSETGEITFHWTKDVKGPVSVRSFEGNHFRMEADLPEGNRVWVVRDGHGSRKESDKKAVELPYSNAINLGNLTFPVAHVASALSDPKTDVSLVSIEKEEGRSIYHLRLRGRLGLVGTGTPAGTFVKEIFVDALTFDILKVEDFPYRRVSNGKPSDIAPRAISYADFRFVNGVKIPFSIETKLEGQPTFSISIREAAFNNNLSESDFTN